MAVLILVIIFVGAAWLQGMLYRRLWHKKLEYDMSFSCKTAVEGEVFTITERLTNSGRLPLGWVTARYSLSVNMRFLDRYGNEIARGEERNSFFTIGAGKTATKRCDVRCTMRGYYRVAHPTLYGGNLLMESELPLSLEVDCAMTVYPKPAEFSGVVPPHEHLAGEMASRRRLYNDPFEFKGIREYQPYDSFKQINFRATARAGELMSNVYEDTASREVIILLNLQNYSRFLRDFVHEQAIRIAAYYCEYFAEQGVPVGLICPCKSVVTGEIAKVGAGFSETHLHRLYTALAHLDITTAERFCDHVPTDAGSGRSYLLISSYHGDDLVARYHRLKDSGATVNWIAPRCGGDTDPLPGGVVEIEVTQ